jgi:FAD/FMN-containing dehydrogenase
VRCIVPAPADAATAPSLAQSFAGTRVVERMPRDWRRDGLARGMTPLELRIKQAFDPDGILNPGLIGFAS